MFAVESGYGVVTIVQQKAVYLCRIAVGADRLESDALGNTGDEFPTLREELDVERLFGRWFDKDRTAEYRILRDRKANIGVSPFNDGVSRYRNKYGPGGRGCLPPLREMVSVLVVEFEQNLFFCERPSSQVGETDDHPFISINDGVVDF